DRIDQPPGKGPGPQATGPRRGDPRPAATELEPDRRQRPVAPANPGENVLARDRAEVPRVGTRPRVVTDEKNRAGGIDRVNPLDDVELRAVRSPGHHHITRAKHGPTVHRFGDDERSRT